VPIIVPVVVPVVPVRAPVCQGQARQKPVRQRTVRQGPVPGPGPVRIQS